jgi:Na+-translocating ferredoxin:NAD+ oxidoreductase subunit C
MNAIINFFKNGLGGDANSLRVRGGTHPDEHKLESTHHPIVKLGIPATLLLPLRQHIGHLPKLKVKVGDIVLKYQLLAEAEGNISAAVHAPSSGRIIAIEERMIPHPSGIPDICIVLETDGKDQALPSQPIAWRAMDKSALLGQLRESGIVGLGGAVFPTQVKLNSGRQSSIKTLVVNGAECEPYITCDDMLMREQAEDILKGIEIAQYLLGAEECIIGIEDNKPQAIEAMRKACENSALKNQLSLRVAVVPTQYPSGDARQLIRLVTGIEVPHDRRSTDVGVQCFNVGTLLTLHHYLNLGKPVVSRIVTVTGHVGQAGNFEVLLGTSVSYLLQQAGGALPDANDFIMGGPMMGFSLPSVDVPVTKATNCIIAGAPGLFPPAPEPMPCIRCARCADACPVQLQPQELYWFSKSQQFEKARDYHLFDCIECGCCSYVCPSNIPLVQYYRFAKSEVIAQDKIKEAANLARERNDFRLMRIEREKQERAQRHAQKALGTQQETKTTEASADQEAKKAAIAAAIERAKALKAGVAVKNTEGLSEQVKREIEEIDAIRESAKRLVENQKEDSSHE